MTRSTQQIIEVMSAATILRCLPDDTNACSALATRIESAILDNDNVSLAPFRREIRDMQGALNMEFVPRLVTLRVALVGVHTLLCGG